MTYRDTHAATLAEYLAAFPGATIHQILADTDIPRSSAYAALRQLDARRTRVGRNAFAYSLPTQPQWTAEERSQRTGLMSTDDADRIIKELRAQAADMKLARDALMRLAIELETTYYPHRNPVAGFLTE